MNMKEWVQQVIKPAEIEKYLVNGIGSDTDFRRSIRLCATIIDNFTP